MARWSDILPTVGMLCRPVLRCFGRWGRRFLLLIGGFGALLLVLAFTAVPFHAHRHLGLAGGTCKGTIDAIVVLGGSGMPSGPELLRLLYTADLAVEHPQAPVFLVHAADTATADLMIEELVMRGVSEGRIIAQLKGSNTREQALGFAADHKEALRSALAIVTAPENMYRTLGAFRKVGFEHACGVPAFDNALFVDLDYAFDRIGGRRVVPDVSEDLDLRYTFWNYLKLEVTCLREYVAIGYYKLNGWM